MNCCDSSIVFTYVLRRQHVTYNSYDPTESLAHSILTRAYAHINIDCYENFETKCVHKLNRAPKMSDACRNAQKKWKWKRNNSDDIDECEGKKSAIQLNWAPAKPWRRFYRVVPEYSNSDSIKWNCWAAHVHFITILNCVLAFFCQPVN